MTVPLHRARRTVAALAAAAAVTSALAVTGGPAAAQPTGSVLRTFAAANMAPHSYTRDEAVAVARQYDVVAAQPGTFQAHVAAMKAANPQLTFLVYLNGTFAQKAQATAYPESWYARDAAGAKLASKGWGNWLMNPREPGWLADRGTECVDRLAASGYDGCFIDMLGLAPLDPGYLTGTPVDPTTGTAWTPGAWIEATTNVARRIKAAAGDRPVVANGLGNGTRYFDGDAPAAQLLDAADAGLAEVWLRTAGAPAGAYKSEAAWKRDVDMVVAAEARGRAAHVMTKVWTGATAAEIDAWHRYALTSFLLAAGGRSAFSFVPDEADATPIHPWDRIDLGAPLGPYAAVGAAYRRDFVGGTVLVNPGTTAVTVDLGTPHTTIDGRTVTSLTLAAHSGEILTASVDLSRITRLAGDDRVATAIAISQHAYPAGGTPGAVLATADDFPDGLAGTPLAGSIGGPLLLTARSTLDARVAAELRRVVRAGGVVHVLGGRVALSDAVESAVTTLGLGVVRHAGATRYDTAAAIARAVPSPTLAVVTTGSGFADALTGGAAAAAKGGVVLLTEGSRLPDATAEFLAGHPAVPAVAVGGPATAAVPAVERLAGADRYETALLVAARFTTATTAVGVASGETFADGLAGGAHAAAMGAPLLLTPRATLAPGIGAFLDGRAVNRAFVYGGTNAASDAVAVALARALG